MEPAVKKCVVIMTNLYFFVCVFLCVCESLKTNFEPSIEALLARGKSISFGAIETEV